MRRVTHNGARRAHFLHLDIRSYFLTINKEILYEIVCDRIRKAEPWWAEEMKSLTRAIIFHDPTLNARRVGELSLFEVIPRGKTLSSTSNRTGLPIGNYTSQFFANVYLDCLDQYAKHELKIRYYLRYVDDLVLLHEDRGSLELWEKAIEGFANSRLRLRLHRQRRRLEPVSNGCDFLGYIVKRTHLLPAPKDGSELQGTPATLQEGPRDQSSRD
jgi:RNA-directed DNA polymerase